MNGPSLSARAGRTRWALCSQIGLSSRNCLSTSRTKAWPTLRVVSSSPIVLNRKLKRVMQRSAVIGVVTARLIVSTIPPKRTIATPGPICSESMRPSMIPRGRGELLARPHLGAGEARLVALHHRHLRRVVHVPEVGGVDAVLGHLLPRRVDRVLGADDRGPLGVAVELGQLADLPLRLDRGVGVVPDEGHAVALGHRVRAQRALLVDAVGVRDLGVLALGVELPAVERADDLAVLAPCRRGRGGRRGAGRTGPARAARRRGRARRPGGGRSRRSPSAHRRGSPPGSRC